MPSRSRPKQFKVPSSASANATGAPFAPLSKKIGLTKHLIVDGYNLIHGDTELKKVLQTLGSDNAREALYQRISILHDYEGMNLTIVFDGRGSTLTIERPIPKLLSLSFVFSPSGVSADEVIEGLVRKSAKRDDVLVSTADSGIRVSIQASGARWIPNDELWRMVNDAEESMRRKLK